MSRHSKIVIKDGAPLAVLRPTDPALALRLAAACIGKSGSEADECMARVLGAQNYKFVGWAAKPSAVRQALGHSLQVVNEHGQVVDEMRVGDSFVAGEIVDGVPKLYNMQPVNPAEVQPK